MHLLALALLGCDAPIYYPEMGSNGLIWDAGDVSGDTAAQTTPTTATGGTNGTSGTGGDPGASEVIELAPGDAVPCASGEPGTFAVFSVTSAVDTTFGVYAVDDACAETLYSSVAPGQTTLINGEVGAAYVLRVQGSGEAFTAIIVGASGGNLVVE